MPLGIHKPVEAAFEEDGSLDEDYTSVTAISPSLQMLFYGAVHYSIQSGKPVGVGKHYLGEYFTVDFATADDFRSYFGGKTCLDDVISVHQRLGFAVAIKDFITETTEHTAEHRFAGSDTAGESYQYGGQWRSIIYSALSAER